MLTCRYVCVLRYGSCGISIVDGSNRLVCIYVSVLLGGTLIVGIKLNGHR